MKIFLVLFVSFFCLGINTSEAKKATTLPIPRFVSLKSSKVNLRLGPGENYPIQWTYQVKNLPVEVIQEFENWRQVRDWQGTQGWIHQDLLMGKRHALVTKDRQELLAKPNQKKIVATIDSKNIVRLLSCKKNGCYVEVHDAEDNKHKGWLSRDVLWGVYPDEEKF